MKINRHLSRTENGFSLIELLVVIGIMLVLVAAFAPAVVSSLQAGNEQATVNNLHQIINAEVSYSRLYPSLGYSTTGSKLGGTNAGSKCPATPDPDITQGSWSCLLSNNNATVLDNGILNGYKYSYQAGAPSNGVVQAWALTAVPSTSYAGRKSYCADSSGSIYYYPQSVAPSPDPTTGACTGGTVLGQ